MLTTVAGYLLLFVTAFGAASLLPFYSEPLLVGLLALPRYGTFDLWLVATAGNTAGAVLNWWLARYLRHWQDRRWFPVSRRQLDRASAWFQRYGVWSLLLSWAPVGGDALTVVAGLLGVRLGIFLVLVSIGKGLRYAVVIWVTQSVFGF